MMKIIGLTAFIGTGLGLLVPSALGEVTLGNSILLSVIGILFFLGLPNHYKDLLK